jgi:transcriptional regulator with XRE-family HTH domain
MTEASGPVRRVAGWETRQAQLRALRRELGMLQSDVAKRSGGLATCDISRIEGGVIALTVVETLRRAARGYGLSVPRFERYCRGEYTAKRAAGFVREAEKRARKASRKL